jgi:inositol hexakisphosphate/diphosphoinositol-pentakisphosphate kinase
VRYVTVLSPDEVETAKKIARAFGNHVRAESVDCKGQTVCGFDILRAGGQSYVIDVNGWSFVKGSDEYYDSCAGEIQKIFLAAARRRSIKISREPSFENQWRLKSFSAVFRHADRALYHVKSMFNPVGTPKQKMKFFVDSPPFVRLLHGALDEVLLKTSEELKAVIAAAAEARNLNLEDADKMNQLEMILESKHVFPGTKVQVKPILAKADQTMLERMQIVVKWGGEFTHAYAELR